MEHSGHGVPIVVREYGEKAYTFSENMITVTIPFDKPETKSGKITGGNNWGNNWGNKVERERRIYI